MKQNAGMFLRVVVGVWLLGLTLAVGVLIRPKESKLFAVWEGDALRIAPVHDGLWLVTHLYDVSNRSVATLPKPIWIVESGGISIPSGGLAKLEWIVPGQGDEALGRESRAGAPGVNSEIRALSTSFERSRFVRRAQ